MARMSNIDYVNLRLESWGIWRAKGLSGLSYPSSTIEAAMEEYGGEIPRGTNIRSFIPNYFCHSEEQEIDKIVLDLSPDNQLLLWGHYVGKEGDGLSWEARVELSGLKKSTYYRKIDELRMSVYKGLTND